MIRFPIIFVGSAFLVGALAAPQQKSVRDDAARREAAEPYEGFKADQALLRKHQIYKGNDGRKELKASSVEAIDAAQRIFARVSFLFRSREEVLDLLGDPATISDYGRAAGNDPSSPMEYVFDTGFGGLRFTVSFGKLPLKVDQVRVDYLD
jgi:hypothetical protein